MIRAIDWLTRLGRTMTFGLLPESLISFLIVGSLGAIVHLCVLKLAMATVIHEFKYAYLVAMLVAAKFNFFLNNKSTFKDRMLAGRHIFLGYFVYLGIISVGMGISMLVATRFYAEYHIPMVAAVCGIVSGSFWNYFASNTLVWKVIFNLSKQPR